MSSKTYHLIENPLLKKFKMKLFNFILFKMFLIHRKYFMIVSRYLIFIYYKEKSKTII